MFAYLVAAYLIGSLPMAYLVTRWFAGRDIRRIGSRNAGATNVLLNAGWLAGALTLAVDMMKGYLAAFLGGTTSIPLLQAVAPAFAIAGHNWPVWLRFRGGGGLATFVGACIAITNLPVAVYGMALWGALFLILRNHDVSAALACIMLPCIVLVAQGSVETVVFTASSSLVVLLRRLQSIYEHMLSSRHGDRYLTR